ncbi:hypothetical protein [Geminocystis sp. NIES-3708]|uniref:hypothetical protein n=1 Tax=Geminocystis sp. NIES-3708 TaxID=1615909 RepID=UPI0011874806|nr:hypothetical protein [Geminocystis sp. NIES-3708]
MIITENSTPLKADGLNSSIEKSPDILEENNRNDICNNSAKDLPVNKDDKPLYSLAYRQLDKFRNELSAPLVYDKSYIQKTWAYRIIGFTRLNKDSIGISLVA